MTIAALILTIFAGLTINFIVYKSVADDLYEGLPKWLHVILLIPPFSIVAIFLLSIGAILYAIYDTIKSL